jgi:hypothetical protein
MNVGIGCHAVETSTLAVAKESPIDQSLYLADVTTITTDQVRQFLQDLINEQLLTENLTVELKGKRDGYNVAEAVCALANTEGGLVLVGLDERSVPAMVGVAPGERDSVVRQLSATLEPPYMPEITTVTADDPGRIVIVLRVSPDDVPAVPMLCRGRAYVRQPGQTTRATRDQLLDLVRRGSAEHFGYASAGASTGSMFFPRGKTGAPDDSAIPDLCLRAAGGVGLLGPSVQTLTVGTALRRHLEALVDNSELVAWAAGHLPPTEQAHWDPVSAKHFLWEAQRKVPRRFAPNANLRLHVHAEGRRVAYYVDAEIRFAAHEQERSTLLSVPDLADGALRLVQLVDRAMPDAISTQLRIPPRHHETTTVWVTAAEQDVHRLVRLNDFPHDVDEQRIATSQFQIRRFDDRSYHEVLESWITTLLLDDGVRDAEEHAREIVASLSATVSPRPWL